MSDYSDIIKDHPPRFPIGTTFIKRGRKRKDVETVVDVLTTLNSDGDMVRRRYIATHVFMGQTVTDYDVIETTIARGIIS